MFKFTKKEVIFLGVLLLLSSFVRFYGLSDQEVIKDEFAILFPRHDAMVNSLNDFFLIPPQDHWDRVTGYNYTSDYAGYHFNKGTQSSTTPLSWWFVSISLFIFGKNVFGARFIPLLFSLLSILLFYFIVRKIYGKNYAMVGAFLLSFYPFYLTMLRVGQTLEPIALFFFLAALYSLLFFNGHYRRILWLLFFSLMFLSNFPKAFILAGIMFFWEFQKLVYNTKSRIKRLFSLCLFYIVAIIPSALWAIVRAKFYGFDNLWFLQHVFARGSNEPFRILEVLYSYSSTKQGALLIILEAYGVFVFIRSIYNKKNLDLASNLNLLWLLMITLIPSLFLFSKQAGAWSHAMASIPIVIFATNGIFSLYNNIKAKKYMFYLFIFFVNWFYILLVKNMGDLINFVPRNDADALTLYYSVFIQLLSSWSFVFQMTLLILFSLFFAVVYWYKLISEDKLKEALFYSLFLSLLFFFLHTVYLVVFNLM